MAGLSGGPTFELEHAISFSGTTTKSIALHPNRSDYVYLSGSCVVVTDLNDPHKQVFLRGHDDATTCLSLSLSGNLLASGQSGSHADVIVWDFGEKRMKYRLSEHDHGISSVSFTRDEKLLVTVGNLHDRKILVWDVSNGYIVAQASFPNDIHTISCGGKERDIKYRELHTYVFATVSPEELLLWTLDPFTGSLTEKKVNMGNAIRKYTCVEFTPDGDYLLAGSESGDVSIISTSSATVLSLLSVCSGGVRSIQVSALGGEVIAGGGDGSVSLLRITGGYSGSQGGSGATIGSMLTRGVAQPIALSLISTTALGKMPGQVTSLSIAADGSEVLCGSSAGQIHRVQIDSSRGAGIGASLLLCESHTQAVTALDFPAGQSDCFATASHDGTIRIWDLSEYSVISRAAPLSGSATANPTCLVNLGECILSGWSDGDIRSTDSMSGEYLWSIYGAHRNGVSAIATGRKLRYFLSGGDSGDLRVWSTRTRQLQSSLTEHTGRITSICMFEDEQHCLSSSRDKNIYTWDLETERRVAHHTHRTLGSVLSTSLHPDQTHFCSVGTDRQLHLWDLRQPQPVAVVREGGGAEMTAVDVSGDGTMIATGGADQMVRLWDWRQQRILCEGMGHSGPISRIQFAPDNRQIVSVGMEGGIFVWNVYQD